MLSRTVTSQADTVVMPTGAGQREIKKPMVMMKHEFEQDQGDRLQRPRSRLHGSFSRPIKINSQLVNILKSHFAIQLPSATGSSSGLSKPTSSAVM
ncbi:Kinesin-like protein kif21b [Puccinia graminis f. sp. tritici]|uniref:Kinesin-like protein kif21b n=1 Tax=Puccinia graminis f. sp. tritici TaxID=56615 RepID=A0A5B0RVE8_PUCGR|nr:Kinesin-like protein kif21b [Puccinia graminis f. sp. tritici]